MFDATKTCPIPVNGKRKPCIKHECHWFIQLQGTNPNTGQPTDEWGCAVAWLPVLLIESAKETRQAAAAIESFRNEMVKPNPALLVIAQSLRQLQPRQEPIPSEPSLIQIGQE